MASETRTGSSRGLVSTAVGDCSALTLLQTKLSYRFGGSHLRGDQIKQGVGLAPLHALNERVREKTPDPFVFSRFRRFH
jgi:hypothetical protein